MLHFRGDIPLPRPTRKADDFYDQKSDGSNVAVTLLPCDNEIPRRDYMK